MGATESKVDQFFFQMLVWRCMLCIDSEKVSNPALIHVPYHVLYHYVCVPLQLCRVMTYQFIGNQQWYVVEKQPFAFL